jgi:hypothetical protein
MTSPSSSVSSCPGKMRAFISYSRKDIDFANKIDAALRTRGIETFIDRSAIGDLEDCRRRIADVIAQSDTVVFILSPDAVSSRECKREVDFASSLNKRFAPILFRPIDDDNAVPEQLARINRIDFVDAPFEETVDRLAAALDTDITWIRRHTEFGHLARRWDEAGRPGTGGLVLRPPLLHEAEAWLVARPNKAPLPTETTRDFIQASRVAYNQEEAAKKASLDRFLLAQSRHLCDLANESAAKETLPQLSFWPWRRYPIIQTHLRVRISQGRKARSSQQFTHRTMSSS